MSWLYRDVLKLCHSPSTLLDNTVCMGISFIKINSFKKKCKDRIKKYNDNSDKQNPLFNIMSFIS